ncbi:sigma factor-like helix-turn-helix DNA-binding protein [Thermoproteota archaeon]
MKQLILNLPEKYKSAASLFYIQKLSLAEISRNLGLSLAAVKSRLFRGRNMLIKQIKNEGFL